jgi:hypothetical protein
LIIVASTLGVVLAALAGDPEVIVLKDGQQVIGEVLAEKANALFVDLGYDVLKIPREQVSERRKPDESGAAPASRDAIPRDVDPSGFYKTAELKSRTVKDLVREYGEGVVSVETAVRRGAGPQADRGRGDRGAEPVRGPGAAEDPAAERSETPAGLSG